VVLLITLYRFGCCDFIYKVVQNPVSRTPPALWLCYKKKWTKGKLGHHHDMAKNVMSSYHSSQWLPTYNRLCLAHHHKLKITEASMQQAPRLMNASQHCAHAKGLCYS
jgi:hypothetical protein